MIFKKCMEKQNIYLKLKKWKINLIRNSAKKKYDINEPVYGIQYQNNNKRWVPGKIVKKIGKTIYEIIMKNKI